ncbi:MAG: enoyl-CoA hydratase [Pseudonocardiales bacterium]|nr:enoyl-CoA hydratase [Pseudonocardiales bacterium]MBV9730223.1 enoyl-CoA hydratase [Pseudonocardiales bacterium]
MDVLIERRGSVAVLTVSDPARRNALNLELSDRLARAVAACDGDQSVRAVVITGAPPAFCAGADLGVLTAAGESGSAADLHRIYAGFLAVANAALPTIAAVNGPAVGAGLNLALACDLRLVGPGALFDARFLQLGIHPGGGMTWLAQHAASPQTAAAMTLFGVPLDAQEAVRTGLAYRLVEADDDPRSPAAHEAVVTAAVDLAQRAAAAPRDLVIATKAALRATAVMPQHADAVRYETAPQLASLRSDAFTRSRH